jgi:acetyl-CoA carboxylase biotin carboxyl carrier protein
MSNSTETKDTKWAEISKFIGKLSEILDKTNLTQLEYENEDCRINLTRQAAEVAVAPCVSAPVQTQAAQPLPSAPSVAPVAQETAAETDYANSADAVKSPMVGVVYLSSDPNSGNYVNVGDTVAAGDTVCLIEAMKTFNPVKAHKGGKVSKILVESGDPVEYGAPLIVIE